jgi:hypothetical protein
MSDGSDFADFCRFSLFLYGQNDEALAQESVVFHNHLHSEFLVVRLGCQHARLLGTELVPSKFN